MNSSVRKSVYPLIVAAAVGAVLIWGSRSLTTSDASTLVQPTNGSSAVPISTPGPNGFAVVAKAVTPAVVNITTITGEPVSQRRSLPSDLRERMEEWFGRPDGPFGRNGFRRPFEPGDSQGRRSSGQGSGVIVSPQGYILTNNHVVDGARDVTVTLPDKREFKGKIVGSDPKTDLAVVKIDGGNLPTVAWGDATELQVGDYVLAVGNPFGLNSTVTLGIVSALGRGRMGITQYEDFIQTDAAINPGNSGGALVNTKGELVGINTAIFSQTGGYQGVGLAVPTTMGKPVFESLIKNGKVIRGYLGVGIQDFSQDLAKSFDVANAGGALVSDVKEDGPAGQAGLKQGDLIVSYQGETVEDAVALQRLVTRTAVGTEVVIKVIRNGHENELTATITEQPELVKTAKIESGDQRFALTGVVVRDLDSTTAKQLGLKGTVLGVVVTDVEPDSGPERAGLLPGDVIREINHQPVKSVKEFEQATRSVKSGERVLILINRRGGSLFLSAKV